jgi:hypothetical protein
MAVYAVHVSEEIEFGRAIACSHHNILVLVFEFHPVQRSRKTGLRVDMDGFLDMVLVACLSRPSRTTKLY